jgi:hypothetical protein
MKRPWLACADCDLPYSDDGFADFVVPNPVWTKITADDGANILCANCIVRRCVRAGFKHARGRFTSGPFAAQ